MKIIFMGTPESAGQILEALIAAKEEIICVVTQPDRPKGRGLKTVFSPVKELALKHNLPLSQPEKAKDLAFVSFIKALNPDLILVVAYGQILPVDLLTAARLGCLNLHASLLPKYRGASPIEYAILNGEKETGISIMKVEEALDTGPVLLQDAVSISQADTTASLEDKLFKVGSKLVLKALKLVKEGKAEFKNQEQAQATYAPRLRKEMGIVDWKRTAEEVHNQVRAFNPWPGAYTFCKGKMLKLWKTKEEEKDKNKVDYPGTILEIIKQEGFRVQTGQGSLLVLEVQAEGGKKMPAYDFAIGHGLKVGLVLPD